MAETIQDTTTATERTTAEDGHAGLQIREDGFALLRDRLRAANRDNPDFEAQADDLLGLTRSALEELRRGFGDQIVQVLADGAWAHDGIDLRTARDSEEIILRIVTRLTRREVPFESATATATRPYRRNGRFFIQLDFDPLPQWEHALAFRRRYGLSSDALGIPLMMRS
jgi:hypothetical protein